VELTIHAKTLDTRREGQPQSKTSGPVGVIGPGTGLGVGTLVPDAGRWILLPGEGGHSTLPPATQAESLSIEVLRTHWPHVSAERALSGAGLVNLIMHSVQSKANVLIRCRR
jgi:glucokinase